MSYSFQDCSISYDGKDLDVAESAAVERRTLHYRDHEIRIEFPTRRCGKSLTYAMLAASSMLMPAEPRSKKHWVVQRDWTQRNPRRGRR